jgi:SAM-dependent methyltransferase
VRVPHNLDHERELWDTFAASAAKEPATLEPKFGWTQYSGHGPGSELLGDPSTVLEIGCGTARGLAWLAERGVKATGVDLSPVMIAKLRERWGDGVRFFEGDVLTFLDGHGETYGAVYSNFGAAWFTDPRDLFPLVYRVLEPGGWFVFSQPPAVPGAYGPQGMYKGGFAGREMFTYRYSYTPATWRAKLRAAGFANVQAHVQEAPRPGHIGTLIVQGQRR